MAGNQEFANLQVLCNNRRVVAKKVYDSLLKGKKTIESNAISDQFSSLLKIFGCRSDLNNEAKQSINQLFNVFSSPPYFLRKYQDGWTSILHERFSVTNIESYALQYSKNAQEHLVIAFGYDDEQFLCVAFCDGEKVFNHRVCRNGENNEKMRIEDIKLFANMVGSTQEYVLRLVNSEYHEQIAIVSSVFKHNIVESSKTIKSSEHSLYTEVSNTGNWR